MSRHDDNAAAFTDLVADLLARTRGWTRGEATEHGVVMDLPGGGTRLLVTRIWGEAVCNSDIVRNAVRYAVHHGNAHGGAVLAALSTLGDLGWAYAQPSISPEFEVLDEPMIAGLAGGLGVDALERYASILRNQGYGRSILPREKWAKPKGEERQGEQRRPLFAFTAQDVRALRDAEGISMMEAKRRLTHQALRDAVARLRKGEDWDLLVDVVEAIVEKAHFPG